MARCTLRWLAGPSHKGAAVEDLQADHLIAGQWTASRRTWHPCPVLRYVNRPAATVRIMMSGVEWAETIHLTPPGYVAIAKAVMECKEDRNNNKKGKEPGLGRPRH
jgi:hypothetical protein